ncbi:DNA-(apurinic or apyrimidinic site) lyase [Camellia lanceoleosa]|uniref:DNA-(Apurinic or apyrimidinic site) lyase n=1 Tax=Camellia lanceoleosa TaxID=1840588 RepID=A0ACC0HX98_9ERIC|nr:DNA-(apurinic or apyrimidinic site) lyase [Camellia lanceoleosa]
MRGKLVDAYRFLHKEKDTERGFSWSGNPVGKYRGKRMRIDYFVASEKLKDRIVACEMHGQGIELQAGKSGFGSFLSLGHSPEKVDRIYMKGPGGRGEVEVAVFGVLDQSKQVSGPSSPTSKSGFATIVRKAANAASVAAKHAYAAAVATRGPDEEMMPLKCCLMSVSLPLEHIAAASVLECVLASVAAAATFALRIPTIGIGTRTFCIGQVN